MSVVPLERPLHQLHKIGAISALSLRNARARNHCYCACGALGDGAGALALRAEAYRTIACGERTPKGLPIPRQLSLFPMSALTSAEVSHTAAPDPLTVAVILG